MRFNVKGTGYSVLKIVGDAVDQKTGRAQADDHIRQPEVVPKKKRAVAAR
jgi:hypothetical protein